MSLIQDALKRKSEEHSVIRPAAPPPAIPVIKPVIAPVVEMVEPAADKKSIQPLFIILSIALIVVLTGLGIYLIKPKSKPVPPVAQVPAPAAPVTTPAPVDPAVLQPAAILEPPVVAVETAKVETVIETVTEPVKKEEPAPVILPVEWPELILTGIAQRGSQSIAIINGKMLSAGRTLGKVTVKEVNDNSVVVECLGERRILYIGE